MFASERGGKNSNEKALLSILKQLFKHTHTHLVHIVDMCVCLCRMLFIACTLTYG